MRGFSEPFSLKAGEAEAPAGGGDTVTGVGAGDPELFVRDRWPVSMRTKDNDKWVRLFSQNNNDAISKEVLFWFVFLHLSIDPIRGREIHCPE